MHKGETNVYDNLWMVANLGSYMSVEIHGSGMFSNIFYDMYNVLLGLCLVWKHINCLRYHGQYIIGLYLGNKEVTLISHENSPECEPPTDKPNVQYTNEWFHQTEEMSLPKASASSVSLLVLLVIVRSESQRFTHIVWDHLVSHWCLYIQYIFLRKFVLT